MFRNCKGKHFRIKLSLKNWSFIQKLQLKLLQNQIKYNELLYFPEVERKLNLVFRIALFLRICIENHFRTKVSLENCAIFPKVKGKFSQGK